MMKRTLSFLLCLIMVLSLAAPSVQASGTDGVYTSDDIMDNVYIDNGSDVNLVVDGNTVNTSENTKLPNPSDLVTDPTEPPLNFGDPVLEAPVTEDGCQCFDLASAVKHTGICLVKVPYMELGKATAEELYAQWGSYTAVEQAFLLEYLYEAFPLKSIELEELLTAPTGSASETYEDGITVTVEGIPQDGSLSVDEAADNVNDIVDAYVAENEQEVVSQLFSLDVSVQDGEGADWQPDETVKMELELPGKKLHKYSKVYVIHVDDNGVATKIEAEVTEDGKIAFETPGFSTFAGFTVDFDYEGNEFALAGLTSIKLSGLFAELQVPLYIEDVVNVEFSNEELLTVEKLSGDWLLTSLEAFETTEALTLTMVDGSVYKIKVTDRISNPATIWINGYQYDSDGNGEVTWNLNWDNGVPRDYDGWSRTNRIGIYGPGTFIINLQGAIDNYIDTYLLDLRQLYITGGAKVILRLGSQFEAGETVTIRAYADVPMFDIDDGALFIRVSEENDAMLPNYGTSIGPSFYGDQDNGPFVKLTIDGRNLATTAYSPLIYMHRGIDDSDSSGKGQGRQQLVIEDVVFKNAQHRAILIQTNELTRLYLKDCTFESSVRDVKYGGGAIYIDKTTDGDTANVVNVREFTLKNCVFNGTKGTGGDGGSIMCAGMLGGATFENCQFLNTEAMNKGGAILIGNNLVDEYEHGDITFTNCTFDGCKASGSYGGAIAIRDKVRNISFTSCVFENCSCGTHGGAISIAEDNNAPIEVNAVTFTGCTFDNNKVNYEKHEGRGGAIRMTLAAYQPEGGSASPTTFLIDSTSFSNCETGSHGGAISVNGTLGNVTIRNNSSFSNNKAAGARGGAVAIACSRIGNVSVSDTTFSGNYAGSLGGALHVGMDGASAPITVGTATVSRCSFSDNKAHGVGGALVFTDGQYQSISVTDTSFNNCDTTGYGGAIGLKQFAETGSGDTLPFSVVGDVLITGCSFENCDAGALSHETWDHDNDPTTDQVIVGLWDHDENPATPEIMKLNGGGGGGAIMIGGTIGGKVEIKGKSSAEGDHTLFRNCTSWNNGGAIGFNTDMVVKGVANADGTKTGVALQYLNIDKCFARDAGGAVYLANCQIDPLYMSDCTVQNCGYFDDNDPNFRSFVIWQDIFEGFNEEDKATYKAYSRSQLFTSFDASGTFRSVGNTAVVATISNCAFLRNRSYSNGGGVYWNANRVIMNEDKTAAILTPSMTIKNTTFDGNWCVRDGAGIYCEATVTVQSCEFMNNEACNRGGAVAQQVYNSTARMLMESGGDEATNLILTHDPSITPIKPTKIHNNKAIHGGGISITVRDTVSVKDGDQIIYPVKFSLGGSWVYNNEAIGDGGGLYYATATYPNNATLQREVDNFQKEILIDNGRIYGNVAGKELPQPTEATPVTDISSLKAGDRIVITALNRNVAMSTVQNDSDRGQANVTKNGTVSFTGATQVVTLVNGSKAGTFVLQTNYGAYLSADPENTKGLITRDVIDHNSSWTLTADASGKVTMTANGSATRNALRYDATNMVFSCYATDTEQSDLAIYTLGSRNGGSGGGVYMDSNQVNTAATIPAGEETGYAKVSISGGSIYSNQAKRGNGGGVYLTGENALCTITGGAIGALLTVDGEGKEVLTPYANIATNEYHGKNQYKGGTGGGIAIYGGARIEMEGGYIVNNLAYTAGGGVAVHDHSTMYLHNGYIEGNESSMGGGISLNNAQGNSNATDEKLMYGMYFDGGVVRNNVASVNEDNVAYGGGICISNSATMKLAGGEVSDNKAESVKGTSTYAEGQEGGGIAVCQNSHMLLEGGLIKDNHAYDGGGIVIRGHSSMEMNPVTSQVDGETVTTYGVIDNNEAQHWGGAIYIVDAVDYTKPNALVIDGGIIKNNRARTQNGGGIYLGRSNTLTISGGDIHNNYSATWGGGIYAWASRLDLLGGNIHHNQAEMEGGAICLQNRAFANINGSKIFSNTAQQGAGVFSTWSSFAIASGELYSNVASDKGGAIYMIGEGTVNITGGKINNNSAPSGGGIYAEINGGAKPQVKIDGGIFTSNSATSANGGAVYLNNCDTVISEGTFDTNTASLDGGALYAIGGTLAISGGSFTANVASIDQGGAMYIDGCNTTISDGTFNDNAGRYGGGMFVNRSTVNFTGGKFTNNKSNQGGGIFIRSSTVNISNITVSGNVAGADDRYTTDNAAYQYGGGLFIDSGSGVASSVTVNSGEFTNNRATHGGGIWIANRSSNLNYTNALTINGGNITNNTATYNGGGILIGGAGLATEDVENNGVITPGKYTYLIMNGGYIARNTAGGNGGGIYADGRAKVFIKGTEAAHGEISFNTANNGGGIYVTTGANLTVTDGYIIKNTAVEPVGSSGLQTAKGNDDQLYGTGGGICVTAGTDAARSTFTLSGDNVAIYGNTATFAADDVFSSGTKTELLVPKVTVMNLAGYGFNPEGWVEDYATTDTAYTSGLNMIGVYAAASSGAAAEMIEKTPVLRYRNAVATQRRYMLIKPEYVIGETEEGTVITDEYANKPDAYVCMTLGIPTAMDDTVVFDYGSEILVNVWMNDLFLDADTSEGGDNDFGCDDSIIAKDEGTYIGHSFTIGTTDGTVREFEDTRYIPITPNTQPLFVLRRTGLYGASGVVYSGGNGTFSYTPNKINISKEDSFFYAAAHNGFWYYANMHVVPATTLYFEDNAHVGQQLFINYHTESSNMTLAPWTTETAGQNAYFRQDEDRPGDDHMSGVDADNIYGYDGTYAYSTKYSNGSASKVIVRRIDEDTTVNARATFTFTGTGFDIISFCSANTGLVSVSVYKGTEDGIIFEDDPTTPDVWDATTPIATYMVDTQYQTGSGIYQVPVIKADLNQVKVYDKDWNWTGDYYGYGTYTVEIYVAPGWLETDPGYNRCEFYLDAIRIYNPAGINGSNSQMAEDAYKADNEQWPVYQELRNLFLSDKELTSETAMNGILFIDGSNTPSIKEYITWGPNNEIYLDANQAVTFTLNPANYGGSVDKVHLAMRGLTGSGNVLVQASNDANAAVAEILNKQLSATDMYYDITEAMGKVLVIKNNGTTPIAISTLKVTHTQEPAATNVLSDIVTTSLEDSLLALEIFNAEQLAEITVTPKRPALSFNGMVCYNVFFDAQDLGDLTAADLGLAVFNTYAPDGTVENANEVHLGAEEIDGLYMVATDGVHAKYLGDAKFFRAFAKKADGSYVYSKMVSYSAVDYAKNILAKSDDVKLKQLVVAMLNYGAEAQKFFGYKTFDLMNKDLTADDLALLNGFDANSLNKVGKVDASKVGAFASTGGFTKRSPAISFKGAFEINYFMTPAYAVDGDMTMYFWTEDTYNSATELTADNADKAVVMTPENGSYTACSDEIIAKYLDKTVYVAAVYESNGVTYCSGVLPYSIAAYCQKPPASVQDLATAAAIYGCTAKQYFGV